jgi:hypothetical protein
MQKLVKTKYPKLVSSKNIKGLLSYKFYAYFCTQIRKRLFYQHIVLLCFIALQQLAFYCYQQQF